MSHRKKQKSESSAVSEFSEKECDRAGASGFLSVKISKIQIVDDLTSMENMESSNVCYSGHTVEYMSLIRILNTRQY